MAEEKEGEVNKPLINPYHAEEQGFVLDFGLTSTFGGFNEQRIRQEAQRTYNPLVHEFVECLKDIVDADEDNYYLLVPILKGKLAEFQLVARQVETLVNLGESRQ